MNLEVLEMSYYSYRSESTGLAIAAFIVWKLTVKKVMIKVRPQDSRNITPPTLIR